MKKYLFLTLLSLGVLFSTQAQLIQLGNSVSFHNAQGDFGDFYGSGFGVKLNGEVGLPGPINITGEVGWNQWSADDSDVDNLQAWDALVGVKFGLPGPVYIEGRGGYLFGDIDEFILIPAAGVRLGKFDVNVGYQVLNDVQDIEIRVAYYWLGLL